MYLFKKVKDLQAFLQQEKKKGSRIGFTPTMGALHIGHLSLIQRALQSNQISVCSVFVNPTQFNQATDLETYPRPIEQDIELLEQAGNQVLFLPTVEEVYPNDLDTTVSIDLNGLDEAMEGAHRPGHFKGVVQVVKRFLDIIQPHELFMGQKDYQQFCIIEHMIRQLALPVEIVMCPTVRESSGLAQSSRNRRLSPSARQAASNIYKQLQLAIQRFSQQSAAAAKTSYFQALEDLGFKPEYIDFVDGHTLKEVERLDAAERIVVCTAVWVEGVRLIDNIVVKSES